MTTRQSICLNGLWSFCPGDGELEAVPEKWEETKIVVPSPWNINSFSAPQELKYGSEDIYLKGGEYNLYPEYPKEWESAKSGWYRRELFIPDDWKGNRLTLCFNAVHFYSEYYINGELVASDSDGFLPYEFEIDRYVRWGEINSLTVGVKKMELFKMKLPGKEDMYECPTGSFWGEHIAGIWQDVYLNVYPPVYIKDVFVHTDITRHLLNVSCEFSGVMGTGYSVEYVLREYKGDAKYNLGMDSIGSDNFLSSSLNYSSHEKDIKLWWPNSPDLYQLDVILKENGKVVYIKTTRFGFRVFEIKGNKFYLNGIPCNLRNDSWHYMGFASQKEEYARLWYKMARDAHVNCIRLHAQPYPEFFLDIADEEGMLIIDESAIWASHCKFNYSLSFVEAGVRHIERLVRRDRNHPSVIIWSVENECVPAYRVKGNDAVSNEEELNKKLYRFSEKAKSLDATRPTSGDGSFDFGGRMEIMSLHYPAKEKQVAADRPVSIGEMGSMYYSTPDCVCNVNGERTYMSFAARLDAIGREAFEYLKYQRRWAAQVCIFNLVWYGLYPLPIKEHICTYEDYSAPGVKPTKIGSYISTLNAGYDPELPEYITNPVFRWVQKAYIPERFFFENEKTRYYSSEKGTCRVSVHNDSLKIKKYILHLAIIRKNGVFFEDSICVQVSPSEYETIDIAFNLPATECIEPCRLHVKMCCGLETVFEDGLKIKVYNARYIAGKLRDAGKIAVIGSKFSLPEYLKNMDSLNLRAESEIGDDHEIYVLAGAIAPSLYERLLKAGKKVFDLSLDDSPFCGWFSHHTVEKAFINVEDPLLWDELDEKDLHDWGGGIVSHYSFKEGIGGNCTPLVTTGKGIPLVTESVTGDTTVVVSCLDIVQKIGTEPAALILFVNLLRYIAKTGRTKPGACVLVSKEDSKLSGFFRDMNILFKTVDPDNKEDIKALYNERLLIADGKYTLNYLDEILPSNAEKILIWNLSQENMPSSVRGLVDVVSKPLNQLLKATAHFTARGVHTGDLYGLEAGDETLMTKTPLKILDKCRVTGILGNSYINWRMWNLQSENIKTISILRNEKSEKDKLYGLAYCRINNIETLINQLSYNTSSNKLKTVSCRLLTNLGVKINYKPVDEFEAALNTGVYDEILKKALVLKAQDGFSPKRIEPAVNKIENGVLWNVVKIDDIHYKEGTYIYCVYIYSPSDRTDLLLNPDLIGASIVSAGEKELLLNDKVIGNGKEICLNALMLKAGWNKLVISEKTCTVSKEPIAVRFTRKDNLPLDLAFSLIPWGLSQVRAENWFLETNYNRGESGKATQGSGFYWDSLETQREGMYLKVDMGDVFNVTALQFASISRGEHGMLQFGTPRCFAVLSSMDGEKWEEIYSVKDESCMTLLEGKVIINFPEQQARHIKILLEDVALKTLRISELKVFAHCSRQAG